ncbi:MAG: protein kinase domain-containing protein [Myxococcota bacterium]
MRPDCPDEQALLDFAGGALPPGEAVAIEQHLEACDVCAAVVASNDEPAPTKPSPDDLTLEAEGRYELQRELGEGAEGRVWLAWDHHLGRAVALKLAHHDADRPLREARLVARLNHPGIVTVFEIGRRADGSLYSAQRLVRAERGPASLREAFARTTTLEERLRLLPRLLQACEAVGHAHACGVVHRDLKPEHIALGDDGETVVIDWGLAVRDDEAPARGPVGTPGYRSPEQEAGAVVGPPADVYSLGVILAETLEVAPPRLRPAPLVAIAERARHLDPTRRYPDAAALAADLTAWLSGGVVGAHDYALGELLRRAFLRHRLALALLAVVLVSTLAALATGSSRADARRALATSLLLRAEVAQAAGGWDEASLYGAAARELADVEPARLMVATTAGRSTLSARVTVWPDAPIATLAWNASTRRLAMASAKGELSLWTAGEPTPRRLDEGHRGAVSALLFSRDGRRLFSAGEDRRILEWDVATGRPRVLREATVELNTLALAPDEAWLAVGDERGAVELVELPSGAVRGRWQAHATPIYALVVEPGGAWLATGAWSGEVRLWTPAGERLAQLDGHQDAITSLALSPRGALLASSSRDRSVRVWRTAQPGAPLVLLGHEQRVASVAWLDEGYLQSASDDGQVRSWALLSKDGGLDEWQCVGVEQLGGPVIALAATDGATIAGTDDGALWRLEYPRALQLQLPWRERISHLEADDAGLLLVEDYAFVHRDPVTGARLDREDSAQRRASQVSLLPDGRRAWLGFGSNGLSTLYLREPSGTDVPLDHAPRLSALIVDPLGRWVGALGNRNEVPLQALDGGVGLTLGGHDSAVFAAQLGPTRAVTGSFDTTIGVFALPSGARLHTLRGHAHGVRSVALSADERRIASGSWDKTVRLWDAKTGAPEATLRGHQHYVSAVAFSPSGQRLASASWDGTLLLWDVASHTPLLRLEHVENEPRTLRWVGEETLLVGGTRFTRLSLEPRGVSLDSLSRERGLRLDGATPRRSDFGGPLLR